MFRTDMLAGVRVIAEAMKVRNSVLIELIPFILVFVGGVTSGPR